MSEFRGEMKTLVQTYVELLYPDDLEMQTALFENITTGKASVTLEEMQDYVATRSSWYAEIEAVNPAMAVVHNQNDEFVGTVEVMDDSDDPEIVDVFVNDDQMNEVSSTTLYEDGQFWEDYDAENSHFGGHSTEPICTTYACRTEIGGTHKGSDAMRFLAFLNEIKNTVGIRNISYEHEGDEGAFGVVVFKFDICKSGYKPTIAQVMAQLDGLRNGMILRGADYEDLHRPIQTLAEGDEPNEEWYMVAETFNAMSFKQWSQDEMNEELHGGQDMDFDSWLNDEIHTHGNIPLREWGYEEEHDEPEHQHAKSMMSKQGKVRTLSGKPHKARKLKKDRYITPEEAKTRLSFRARKGIDTFAEPFEEIGDFYSGAKGILKIVGLGALVSVGVWITKNKLLE